MNQLPKHFSKRAIVFCVSLFALPFCVIAQVPAEKPREKPVEKSAQKTEEPPNAAQIEILETKYRFETSGDSRKEVHAVVKINSELGVRQFARLNFDYNRSFQSVDIPLARITHANGGTSDILPSAITDVPNPAVEKFPAYQDVRVKSVRILGLQPGDSLEYRVTTTTTKPPLAPDFWLDHSFDRSGVVTREIFELDLPAGQARIRVNPETAATPEKTGEGGSARATYRWEVEPLKLKARDSVQDFEDIALTTFTSWSHLSTRVKSKLFTELGTSIYPKAEEWANNPQGRVSTMVWYKQVAQKMATVDLPFDMQQFVLRNPEQIFDSRYGTPEEKVRLLYVLETIPGANGGLFAYTESPRIEEELPRPSLLGGVLLSVTRNGKTDFLDPGLEVAPYGMLPAKLRGKKALRLGGDGDDFIVLPQQLPFAAKQEVSTSSSINSQGVLSTRVAYHLRGDNELLLRVTFHKTAPDKQKEIAQYLALSDGFRGKVTNVKTSDPYDTEKPFEVEYELTQEKFVDWPKKPVRIPALLPLPGLPDVTKKVAANSKLELGTPLDITLTGTLRLPPGTIATAPAGTSVKRDYATFTSTYSSKANILSFSRHLNFLLPEIPSDRLIDLNAFIHAVQSDQSQLFVLDKPESVPSAKPK
jgi:hypothetical protein